MHPFRWLTIAILALLLAACSGGAPKDAEIVIPPGASIAKAGEILEDAGLVSASSFRNEARFFGSDDPIKPGEYKVEKGMDAGDILEPHAHGCEHPLHVFERDPRLDPDVVAPDDVGIGIERAGAGEGEHHR